MVIIEPYHPNYKSDCIDIGQLCFKMNLEEMLDLNEALENCENGNPKWYQQKFMVIKTDNQIIGFGGYIRLGINDWSFGLNWVCITPNHQGKGCGQKLVMALLKEIKTIQKGKILILLTTHKGYFYSKIGFDCITVIDIKNSPSEYIMRKLLK